MEILLRTLGLSNAADTFVGNAIVRGVSGGERKRVTSAEMLVGPKARTDSLSTVLLMKSYHSIKGNFSHCTQQGLY